MIDTEKYAGFADEHSHAIQNGLTNQVDAEIKKRIIALGVDITDLDYIRNNFEFIETEGDEFKHLFYKPLSKFIFSIQKIPSIDFSFNSKNINTNEITCTASYKYY